MILRGSHFLSMLMIAGLLTFSVQGQDKGDSQNRFQLQPQLAQSLPLIGVDKVHRELGITGRGIGVFIIDWFSYPGDHGYSVMDIIRAIAPEVDIWYCDATGLPKEEIIPRCLEGLFQKPDIYQRIYVMNMSFKSGMFFAPHTEPCDIFFGPQSTAIREFTKYRLAVASAGNDGYTNAILFPACLSEVMSVGASYDSSGEYIRYDSCSEVTHVDWLTCYSNRAYFLDIVAPGTIVSTPSNPNFGGTSAAAPIVTGVAALMFSANPNLTPAQVRQIMKQTADLAYDPVNDQFFPRINAYRAVKAVLPYIPPPPVVNQPPAAAFTYSPVNPKPGDVIVFDCSPSRDPDGSVVSCQWNFFGQGTHISELGKLHYHRFDHEGTFVVVLTVYDNLGLSSSTSQTITVKAETQPPPPPPSGGVEISLEATATRVVPGQEIIVRARITNNGVSTVTMPVPFTVDGKPIMTSNITLDPGRTEILEFKIAFSPEQAGAHTVTVGNSPPLTIHVEGQGPGPSKTPEQFFDSNANGRLDDLEILTALDYWIKQRPVPDIGVLSELQILALLDKWLKGTPIAGQR